MPKVVGSADPACAMGIRCFPNKIREFYSRLSPESEKLLTIVLDCYSQLLMEIARTRIPCIIPDCAFAVILLEDYKSFLDYAKKHGKKTSQEDAVRSYYSTKARSTVLKSLSDQLTVRWLGLDATKVDNLFIIVHLPEAKHWILAQVDLKESQVTIYDSIRLKHDKYQRHRNALSAHLPRIIYMMNQDAGKTRSSRTWMGRISRGRGQQMTVASLLLNS